jgi:hypothetical protein
VIEIEIERETETVIVIVTVTSELWRRAWEELAAFSDDLLRGDICDDDLIGDFQNRSVLQFQVSYKRRRFCLCVLC